MKDLAGTVVACAIDMYRCRSQANGWAGQARLRRAERAFYAAVAEFVATIEQDEVAS